MANTIYDTPEYRIFERRYFSELAAHQVACTDEMLLNNHLTICMPTGTGKSRIIYADLLDRLKRPTFDTVVIASHRLLLNVQHFNEMFETFKILASKIGFIFVGSSAIDISSLMNDVDMNTKLAEMNVSYNELISTCLSPDEIDKTIKRHQSEGRDTIIITTYHSLDKLKNAIIDTIYCDEAHFLATTKETAQFKNNFEQINAERKYFFTATPKDLVTSNNVLDEDDVESFLMNNENIFGKRIGITFKEAIDECLIVKPYIHLVELSGFDKNKKYCSSLNYAKVINEAFQQHKHTIKNLEKCSPKILVKCPSVEMIWSIKKELEILEVKPKIFAGASSGPDGNFFVNDKLIANKNKFLQELQELGTGDEAIILHYDILSEGIDVPGITGVMFLSKELPTKPKILQTIGRSTRLIWEDRKSIHIDRTIGKFDYDKMIKPNCAVILPVMSEDMEHSVKMISEMIIELRDNCGFKPEVYSERGDDVSKTKAEEAIEGLNDTDNGKGKFSRISEIEHYIELYDNSKIQLMEEEKIIEMHALAKKDVVEYVKVFSEYLKN